MAATATEMKRWLLEWQMGIALGRPYDRDAPDVRAAYHYPKTAQEKRLEVVKTAEAEIALDDLRTQHRQQQRYWQEVRKAKATLADDFAKATAMTRRTAPGR